MTASFNDFRNFIIKDNSTQIYDPSTAHLAFKDDRDFKPRHVATAHKLGLASTVLPDNNSPATDEMHLTAAAHKMVSISEEDMREFKKLKAKAAKAAARYSANPTTPAASTGPIFGKICFNCGWGAHNSRRCSIMFRAPAGSFTPAQMALVMFSPSTDPHVIDGKAICQVVAPGYKPRE